jgi:hypothetical protein
MSPEFTNFINSSMPRARLRTCIFHVSVRNAQGLPESVAVDRESIRPGKLLEQRATSSRVSVVFTVGGPLVYQRQSDQFA